MYVSRTDDFVWIERRRAPWLITLEHLQHLSASCLADEAPSVSPSWKVKAYLQLTVPFYRASHALALAPGLWRLHKSELARNVRDGKGSITSR
jgi:hypothetical protein